MANPVTGSGGSFTGVSCASAGDCVAAGYAGRDASPRLAVFGRTGVREVAVPVPSGALAPPRQSAAQLSAVGCAATGSCMVVGAYDGRGDRELPLVERFDGSSLSVLSVPAPAHALLAALQSVSCPSPRRCVAVGFVQLPAYYETLVETWNGTRWALAAGARPAGSSGETQLAGVSCPDATTCLAVGSYGKGPGAFPQPTPLVMEVTGTSWRLLPVSAPYQTVLQAVSCTGPASCITVGFEARTSSTDYRLLAERSAGSGWRAVSVG
ncbi:MAG: hypothetical protein ACYDEN_07990 [Acidimicrobiales bacterium]